MSDTNNSRLDGPRLNRRRTLQALGAGVGAVAGLGAFAGSAAAWGENDVDFKGCSSVWMIVSESDITDYDPPTVADVIVETEDGGLDCRRVHFTEESTTTIPGQHGDAPVLKYSASSGEKILGVIMYNYSSENEGINPDIEHPLRVNPNRCAHTPGTPDPRDASCAENTFLKSGDIIESRGASGDKGQGNGHGDDDDHGNGHGNDGHNGKGR